MSVENTNTPNGDSKNLYLINEDVNKQELAVTDMSQKDPNKDLTGNVPGDNTVAEEYVIIDNSVAIRDFGSVRIGATLVGQPMIVGPEAENSIKLSVAEVKRAIAARGALTAEAYIEAKKARIEGKDKKEQEVDNDKNNDGIDDRNQ